MADNFVDIPIDVTAEQIEVMAKRQIDTVAKKGSGNLITSDAVANIEIDGDNILPKSVDTEHLIDLSATPEKLDRKYARLHQIGNGTAIRTGAELHNYLVTGVTNDFDELEPFRKICMFSIGAIDGLLSVIGTGRYIGFYISPALFSLTNLSTGKTYHIQFTTEEVTEIIDVTEKVINNKLSIFDLGEVMAFNHFISKSLIKKRVYRFTLGAGLKDKAGVGPFLGTYIENDYNNDGVIDSNIGENRIVKCMDLSSGIRWNIDLDNKTITEDTSYLNIDQTYDPDSENAQSGIAINEAFKLFSAQHQQITKVTLEKVTYLALLEAIRTYGAIMFDTLSEPFTGAETELNLPRGCYVAFYEHAQVACWHFDSGVLYRLVGYDRFDTGEYTFYVTSSFVELQNAVGDINTALDNIIAIQESYIGGAFE